MATLITACKGNRCETADGPRERSDTLIGNVDEVTLSMVANLSLKVDTGLAPSMEIVAQPAVQSKVIAQSFENQLTIELDGCVKEHDQILLNAVIPDLSYVEITSAGLIESARLIEKDTMEMINSGLGDLDFVIDTQWLLAEIRSSGDIKLAGQLGRLDFLSTSSGDLRAFNLVTDTVSLNILGTSVVEVYANDVLNVHFFRSGTVSYRGNPAQINIEGEGTVTNANL